MKIKQRIYIKFIVAMACFASCVTSVHATAWLDFAQGGQWPMGSTNNVILKKSATCPKNGYLLTTGGGSIGGYYSSPRFIYSLIRNTVPPYTVDYSHYGVINLENDPGKISVYNLPFSLQRVDSCRAGQTIQFRFIGILESGYIGEYNYVDNPTLVIQFFDTLI